ncbi:glycosyltransferase family 4 protein [Glutamicibacter ardleyensis]|uniref:glycosyltransferase family 4 protein n=1 Tax=Glutamicibacter ardleyensis TaxID=225894 RepID=UPI003FD5547F
MNEKFDERSSDFEALSNDLKATLGELDKAHAEIARLVRISRTRKDSLLEAGKNPRADSSTEVMATLKNLPEVTSRFDGVKALDFYIREKKYDLARIWAKATGERLGKYEAFNRSLRTLHVKLGNSAEALNLSYKLARPNDVASVTAIRKLEGRYKELHGWVPHLAGPTKPLKERVTGRILHLVKESRPFLSNGFVARSHKNFVAEKQAGLEPIVVTEPGFPDNIDNRFQGDFEGITHVRLSAGKMAYEQIPADSYLQLFAELAYEEVKKFKPEAIHVSSGRRGYDTALVGLALQKKTGLPLVYEVRSFFEGNWTGDMEIECEGETFQARMNVERMCMEKADRVLTIGESMKAELIERGVPESKIGIIPNAVDSSQFSPRPRNLKISSELGIGDVATFGYVSNMDHYRESQETLIQACHELKIRGANMKCVLVGGGPRMAELQKMADELGIRDLCIFTGPVNHDAIQEYYSLIDFFVIPRIPERAATYVTPLKPFEAMAQKKPIIVSDLPALVEIADPPNRGLSFEPGNYKALADRIQELEKNKALAEKIAQAGYDWVTNNRTWELNGQRYVKELAKVKVSK